MLGDLLFAGKWGFMNLTVNVAFRVLSLVKD